MRHHTALQRSDTKLWHYVSAHARRGTYPIGYCAGDCAGHETEDEAREHARQYLLDHLKMVGENPRADSQHRCDEPQCQEFTSGGVHAPWGRHWTLCEKHRTRATVEALLPAPLGDAWTSLGP